MAGGQNRVWRSNAGHRCLRIALHQATPAPGRPLLKDRSLYPSGLMKGNSLKIFSSR